MIKTNSLYLFVLILIACSLTSCLRLISKTPGKVNPNPIYMIQLDRNFDMKSTLLKPNNLTKFKYIISPTIDNLMSIGTLEDTIKDIFRNIEIYQFRTNNEAQEKYNNYKKTFLNGERAGKIYKEKSKKDNKFYFCYKTIRFDYNHGIPYKILNDPDIWIGFLNNNYFIHISYVSYSFLNNKKTINYTRLLNNDIINISNFLNEIKNIQKQTLN